MTAPHSAMPLKMKILYHILRICLAFIFIYASIDKILHPADFAGLIFNYQVLPGELINLTALIMPWLELILGGCLLFNRLMPGAASLAVIMMTIFMGLIISALARGLDISCGCFSASPAKGPMDKLTLARDFLFFILALGLFTLTFYKDSDNRAKEPFTR